MFIKIPFESSIPFKTNISEITKMSLEHDYNVSGNTVLGNFYISGEYKTHEVSINKEPFRFTLPFEVEISDRIKEDSLEFNIEDFSYDVEGNNTLKVKIEYSLSGEEREEEEEDEEVTFERVNEDELTEELNIIDDFLDKEEDSTEERVEEVKEEKLEEVKEKERQEEKKEEPEVKEETEEVEEERLTSKEEKTIMDTIKDSDDTFVTYHVHIVKESETIESISSAYGVPSSLVKEYNTLDNIEVGDKVLIPKLDE